jgi:hypothetical protein
MVARKKERKSDPFLKKPACGVTGELEKQDENMPFRSVEQRFSEKEQTEGLSVNPQ